MSTTATVDVRMERREGGDVAFVTLDNPAPASTPSATG